MTQRRRTGRGSSHRDFSNFTVCCAGKRKKSRTRQYKRRRDDHWVWKKNISVIAGCHNDSDWWFRCWPTQTSTQKGFVTRRRCCRRRRRCCRHRCCRRRRRCCGRRCSAVAALASLLCMPPSLPVDALPPSLLCHRGCCRRHCCAVGAATVAAALMLLLSPLPLAGTRLESMAETAAHRLRGARRSRSP